MIEWPYENCAFVNGNSPNPYNYWLKCIPNQKSKGITFSNEPQRHKTLIFITRRALNLNKVTKPLFLLSEMNFEVNTKSPNPYNYCLKCIIFVTMFTETLFSLEINSRRPFLRNRFNITLLVNLCKSIRVYILS